MPHYDTGCRFCTALRAGPWNARRGFLLAAGAAAAAPALAQVDVGSASQMRRLVPAEQLEAAADQQYDQMLAKAKAQRALAGDTIPSWCACAVSASASSPSPPSGTTARGSGSGK